MYTDRGLIGDENEIELFVLPKSCTDKKKRVVCKIRLNSKSSTDKKKRGISRSAHARIPCENLQKD